MPLNDEQTHQYNRFKTLGAFVVDNRPTLDTFAPAKEWADEYLLNLQGLEDVIGDKNTITTGITTEKDALKVKTAKTGARVCRLTYSWAKKYGNDSVAAKMNFVYDKIYKMKDGNIRGFVETISGVVTPLLTDATYTSYGITDGIIVDWNKDAVKFDGMIGKAKATDLNNTVGDEKIDKAIAKLIDNVHDMDDLVVHFEETDPEFVDAYHKASSLDDTGVRHNGMEGLVKDAAGNPVAGAIVRLKGTHYEVKTDLYGAFRLSKVKAGDYVVEVVADGFEMLSEVHHIQRRKIEEVTFVLTMAQ